eukprot:7508409-Alexandrium_andersonii.AAC.1
MSASLVGSEMCIRDRAEPHREALRYVQIDRTATDHGKPSFPVMKLIMLAPVSYTHLTLPTICSV